MLGRGMGRPVDLAGYVVCCLQCGTRMGLWWVGEALLMVAPWGRRRGVRPISCGACARLGHPSRMAFGNGLKGVAHAEM